MSLDFVVFNDLSCASNLHDKESLLDLCDKLITAFKRANQMGVSRMRTRSDFVTIPTTDEFILYDSILALPFEKRNLFLSILDCPYIQESEIREVDMFLGINVVRVNGVSVESAEGLISAYVHKCPSVSMLSDSQWDASSIEIEYNENAIASVGLAHILHASREAHFDVMIEELGLEALRVLGLIPTPEIPLPNAAFAKSFLAKGDWQKVATRIRRCSAGERIAIIGPLAQILAKINGYVFEPVITSTNQQAFSTYRQIFSFGDDPRKFYLSTDFEKGAFEVCGRDGRHLGEFLFSGVRSSEPDATGRHDLIV